MFSVAGLKQGIIRDSGFPIPAENAATLIETLKAEQNDSDATGRPLTVESAPTKQGPLDKLYTR